MPDKNKDTHIFIAYASNDKEAHDTLLSHLKLLQRKHHVIISSNSGLKKADIVLMLISIDFMVSDEYEAIKKQLEKQPATDIIPVLIRPCDWELDPFMTGFNALPRSGQFVRHSATKNERLAYREIVKEIKKIVGREVEDLLKPKVFTDITNRAKKVVVGKTEGLAKAKTSVIQTPPPKVFISYSWDSEVHKVWVKHLADELFANGIDVVLDQYEMKPGDNMNHFMEHAVADVDKVLLILTENYKKKADRRGGGVGYEYSMINAEWYKKQTDIQMIVSQFSSILLFILI